MERVAHGEPYFSRRLSAASFQNETPQALPPGVSPFLVVRHVTSSVQTYNADSQAD